VFINVTTRRDVYAAVVFYCHTLTSVKARFLYRAQDHNMTNGDFAFFTFAAFRAAKTDQPWNLYDDYAYDEHIHRRRRAFYAVKQVLASFTAR